MASTTATRRTVRQFAPDPVPWELIERAVRGGGMAPSGAIRPANGYPAADARVPDIQRKPLDAMLKRFEP